MAEGEKTVTFTDDEFDRANASGAALQAKGHAVEARYDAATARLVVVLQTGVELRIPTRLIQDLADVEPSDLTEIEVTPAGLGLHWPRLDADVYVPGLMAGVYGTRRWMDRLHARQLETLTATEPGRRERPPGRGQSHHLRSDGGSIGEETL